MGSVLPIRFTIPSKEGNKEQKKVTFRHSNDPCVGTHHQHTEVGSVASHTKYGRLEVLLVSS